jgi:hypothetical protein
MYRRLLLIAAAGALLIGTASARTLEIVEGAYEAALADVTLPGSIAGTLIVRICGTCEAKAHQVDSATVYIGPDRKPKPFAEFLAAVAQLRATPGGEQSTSFAIFYNIETNRVTKVSVHSDVQ